MNRISPPIGFLAIGAIAGFLVGFLVERSLLIEVFSGKASMVLDPGQIYPYEQNELYGYFRLAFGAIGAILGAIVGHILMKFKKRNSRDAATDNGA